MYETHDYDVVVVGAGGAGLRATWEAEQGLAACVTKYFQRSYSCVRNCPLSTGPDLGGMPIQWSDWLGLTNVISVVNTRRLWARAYGFLAERRGKIYNVLAVMQLNLERVYQFKDVCCRR